MHVIILFLGVWLIRYLIDKLVARWSGRSPEKLSETEARSIEWQGMLVFLILLVGAIIFAPDHLLKWFFMAILAGGGVFRTILELKYLRETKQYISTIATIILGLGILYNFEYIFDMIG